MPFKFRKTEIEGLVIIVPHTFHDERGVYKKIYEKNVFASYGIDCSFTESSDMLWIYVTDQKRLENSMLNF